LVADLRQKPVQDAVVALPQIDQKLSRVLQIWICPNRDPEQ
jgi:hypothetical protein